MVLATTALNMLLDDRILVITGRSPLSLLAFGREGENDRAERIRTSGLLLPKQALYQAKLRPVAGSRSLTAPGRLAKRRAARRQTRHLPASASTSWIAPSRPTCGGGGRRSRK